MTSDLLWHALGICPGDVVVFVGAGEEERLALRVAEELTRAGRPPVLTATAQIPAAGITPGQVVALRQPGDPVVLVLAGEGGAAIAAGDAGAQPLPPADLVVPVGPAPVLGELLGRLPAPPAGARVVPVLTGAAGPGLEAEWREAAALVGRELPGGARVGRMVLADPGAAAPVRAVLGEAAALVLAGGASRRFGGNKLLHPWAGATVLEASLQAPLRAGLKEVVVVTGAYHRELAPLLARYPVRVVPNPDWAEGMASSLRAGVRALTGGEAPGAVVVCLGDMPFLPPAVLTELVRAHARTRAPVVAPVVAGARRNPVLFDRALLPLLLEVRGDEGGRSVVQRYREAMVQVPFPEEGWFRDVDGPADLG